MLKRKEGMIVFVSSVTGHVGHEDETIYTMTKFAQRGLSQAIDKELGEQGIKTCVMCASATKTDFEVVFGGTKEGVVKLIGKKLMMLPKEYYILAQQKIKFVKLE